MTHGNKLVLPFIVLKALLEGAIVTIKGSRYKIVDGELYSEVVSSKGGKSFVNSHMILAVFIEMCEDISPSELACIDKLVEK
jgi:hypothetical protein